MALNPGTRIGPYEILAPLGAGGMGEVYRARDTRLDRDVAVKVLPAHLSRDPDALARFEREAKAVAALSHPNILAIHDFGDHGGVAYAVMELLEGENLRNRLLRSQMAWPKAIEITTAIAEGLSAAHAKGIIHRDLKPENLFLTSGDRVKILDFGLARSILPGLSSEMTAVTEPGVVMGTAAYMSPEQARGAPVGPPGDIFSLGCVLYEMVTGLRAFDRPTSVETLAAILNEDPPEIPGSGRQIPADLKRVIAHCLEKNAQERFQSARDLAFNLRAVGTRTTAPVPPPPPEQSDTIDSLAVLPFVNAGGNPDTDYLSDGIAESLINSLSQIPNLRVVPRSRAFRFKGQDVDARKAGRQLKVRALLMGKVLQRGDTLNVQAELVDVARDSQLWGERFHRKVTDIFTVEEEIAKQITEKLRLKLTGQDKERLLKHHTENTEAYHLYLKGLFHWNKRTSAGLKKGVEYFEEAIEKDPAYAMAYAGLAEGYMVLNAFAPDPANGFGARAKGAALRALEIAPGLAEALAALAVIYPYTDWNWAEGERSARRAIELKPDYFLAHDNYALLLSAMGRHEEAAREIRRSMELEPLSLVLSHHFAWISIRARRYDQAIDQCRKALDMDPSFSPGHHWLGLALGLKGVYDEAIAELEVAHRTAGSTFVTLELTRVYAASGQTAEARRMLAEMHRTFDESYAEPYGFAAVYAALGQPDEAFKWLEEAARARTVQFALWVNNDPRTDSLRSDPRMTSLLRRVGLEQNH
jgi:serine/threonine protein kinase/tetratricopeptide (TPR) repeat protein